MPDVISAQITRILFHYDRRHKTFAISWRGYAVFILTFDDYPCANNDGESSQGGVGGWRGLKVQGDAEISEI